MTQETLQELFVDQIRDLYDAEKQIVKALPKMAKAANAEELSDALQKHLQETQQQVSRLEEIFRMQGVPAKGKPCKGMKGLLEEGSEALEEEDENLMDLSIIAAAQKVEHYEISAYGTAKAIAEKLGDKGAMQLLEETEEEESAADSTLTEIAMSLYDSTDSSEDMEEDEEVEGEEEEEESRTASAGARGSSRPMNAGPNSKKNTSKRR